jgi:hypothetical protein
MQQPYKHRTLLNHGVATEVPNLHTTKSVFHMQTSGMHGLNGQDVECWVLCVHCFAHRGGSTV